MVEWAGCDLSDSECGVMFDPRCANSNINTSTILGSSLTAVASVQSEWCHERKKYEQTNKQTNGKKNKASSR